VDIVNLVNMIINIVNLVNMIINIVNLVNMIINIVNLVNMIINILVLFCGVEKVGIFCSLFVGYLILQSRTENR